MAKKKRSRRRRGLGGLGAVTTKDFVGVAGALCRTGASVATVTAVASYFQSQNPRFDFDRFYGAGRCGKK